MCPKLLGWRSTTVSLVVLVLLSLSPAVFAATIPSLSGYVYLDVNGNGAVETTDYAIRYAKLTLTRSGDPSFSATAWTNAQGFYKFDKVDAAYAGTYTITETCYTCDPGAVNVGQLFDENGFVAPAAFARGTVQIDPVNPGNRSIVGIDLDPQQATTGVGYNFAAKTYPLELVTKRMFMDWGVPDPVPEPGVLAMLAVAGAAMGLAWYRRRP